MNSVHQDKQVKTFDHKFKKTIHFKLLNVRKMRPLISNQIYCDKGHMATNMYKYAA